MRIEENKPLAPFTTFGIGGPARWFVEAASEDEIVEATGWARERELPLFVLGGGSNLLVSDAGFDGLVLRIAWKGILAPKGTHPKTEPEGPWFYGVAAGEDWDSFVEYAVRDNCAGIECLAGIPGTVGGTPVQNVGAYGQEVASSIGMVRAFDLREGVFREFTNAECEFASLLTAGAASIQRTGDGTL
ncbi:MAG: FAD-binding protein [Terracidiphilus sp.]